MDQPEKMITVLEDIKKLLVLSLVKNGVSQEEVAKALGVNQSSISRLFGKSKVKK